jgi:hypothetical protein
MLHLTRRHGHVAALPTVEATAGGLHLLAECLQTFFLQGRQEAHHVITIIIPMNHSMNAIKYTTSLTFSVEASILP